jgi:hypothetical protein
VRPRGSCIGWGQVFRCSVVQVFGPIHPIHPIRRMGVAQPDHLTA